MFLRTFTRLILGLAFIVSFGLVHANTGDSTTISINVVVPERAENQKCTIGFENSLNDRFVALQHSGCQYQTNKLMQHAYQQVSKQKTLLNSQGIVTVVVTAP